MNGMARSSAASSLIFVLCVHIVARLTDGYGWGIAASVAAVLLVNFVFTYPFMEFNFTIAGYPLTFVTMLTVSISTSALTTNVKRQERLRMEGRACQDARGPAALGVARPAHADDLDSGRGVCDAGQPGAAGG